MTITLVDVLSKAQRQLSGRFWLSLLERAIAAGWEAEPTNKLELPKGVYDPINDTVTTFWPKIGGFNLAGTEDYPSGYFNRMRRLPQFAAQSLAAVLATFDADDMHAHAMASFLSTASEYGIDLR